MDAHTVMKASQDLIDNLVSSDSGTDYKPKPSSKAVLKPPSNARKEIPRALHNLGVATRTVVEAGFKNFLTIRTNTPQWHILKAVALTFEDALQANYFNSNHELKSTIFNLASPALG